MNYREKCGILLDTGTLRILLLLFKVNFRNQNMMFKLFHISLIIILQKNLFKKYFLKAPVRIIFVTAILMILMILIFTNIPNI